MLARGVTAEHRRGPERSPSLKCWYFCKIEIILVGMNRNVITVKRAGSASN
jgi:hypothetical protein